jgi:DNA polymerase I-like protein with 3'-5' exonuclease and polymerase domains
MTFDAPSGFIVETLFKGAQSLDLMCELHKGPRAVTVALNGSADELYRDEINLNRADHRSLFVKSLPYEEDDDRAEIVKALQKLAARRDSTQKETLGKEPGKTEDSVLFKKLSDGRLIEQLHGGQFALYDGSAVEYVSSVECDGITYTPITGDPCIEDNDLHLPERLTEYDQERFLDEEIETYLATFCDAHPRELKFAAKLIRLTYIQDQLIEVPYLHIVGPSGSGKTRMSDVVGMACHLPYMIVEGSAASTFRISDKYGVTMCFDEFNPQVDSEDQQALIQILNAGFQRRRKVPRVEKGPNGEFVTRSFRPFGIKIFSGLKLTSSYAFQRRTIPIQLSVTKNPKIPYCDDGTIDVLSAPLREKLTLWRLRNLTNDYRALIRKTEAIFKSRDVMPGFVQIGVPLAMLIEDETLRDQFISSMQSRTDDAKEDRRQSMDGQSVSLIHSRLFDVLEDGTARWKVKGDLPELVEGEPCEALRIDLLKDSINADLLERQKFTPTRYGIHLKSLGFRSAQLKAGAYKGRSAVIYSQSDFERVFNSFSLPIPAKQPSTPSTPDVNVDKKELAESRVGESVSAKNSTLDSDNSSGFNGLGELVEGVEGCFPKYGEGEESGAFDSVPAEVSVDTETEPFTKKHAEGKTWVELRKTGKTPVTPRNAKMIGLALSYDGEGRSDYVTDPGAWPLLMPEADQTVVFHNAKFDLGVLKRTGLSAPEKWEDTLIAAHLLNETGEHGLKPLAKTHLGIEDPTTFEEADRMRLLNPEIFEEYARNDARYTFRLWPQFRREMERQGLMAVYELEKAVLPTVMAMEDAGMKLDLAQMGEMRRAANVEADRIKAFIFESVGCEFDLNSARSVGVILYDTLGLPCANKTKGGQRSVDKRTLREIRGQHPAVDGIIEWREVDKIARDFLTTLPAFADENGRIHPEFKQLGATSGRFSCSTPNVQQIPKRSDLGKKLRRMFVADERNALVVADWSQMELRILAQYSKDPLLLSAYTDGAGTDLHRLTASKMFGKSETEVTDSERSVAKMINFGIAYGITAVGLFNRLKPQGVDVTLEQCEQFISDYFKAYSGVQDFIRNVEHRLREKGYVKNWFGRRRRVSGRNAREIRQAQNFIIQGTGADMAKEAMVRLHSALPEGAKLISVVHDEFIVECRQEQAEDVRALMVEIMQATPEGFDVPMVVEAKIANNWGDAK